MKFNVYLTKHSKSGKFQMKINVMEVFPWTLSTI